ncbi:MAG: hypothetical protein H6719_15585 [Sandaracinaceae bacterium]|nr:hypothetical protein [Sandaracinaceae bacterium]
MRTIGLALALGLGLALCAPGNAEAQSGRSYIERPHTGGRPFQLDIHGGFTWWGVGAATGIRFGIPLVENGFVDSINNAVYLNFGFDFYWIRWRCQSLGMGNCNNWDYNAGFGFPVTLHWEFYFSENWSAFAEVGGQFFIHPAWWDHGNFDWREPGMWFVWTVGGSFHVSENFLLTLRVGSPYIAFGLTFQFGG